MRSIIRHENTMIAVESQPATIDFAAILAAARIVEDDNGWQWYGVCCHFEALGDEFEASLWGIDDAECAEREIKIEMALDVAHQLEEAGYTVTGLPIHRPGFLGWSRENKHQRIHGNLAAQNWSAP